MTFTERMQIYWDDQPISLESHPGPATGAIWAVLPGSQVCFVGDAVVAGQPPFLASADLPAWIDALQILLEPAYQNYPAGQRARRPGDAHARARPDPVP